jgi:hypothetical protein
MIEKDGIMPTQTRDEEEAENINIAGKREDRRRGCCARKRRK